jgi:Alpha-tubulin suppressor and related RCC1 domain-containing proteins
VRKAGGGSLTGVTSVGAGGQSDCASTSDGSAWCWGVNDNGELGNGTTTASSGAVRVTRSSGGNLTGVSTVTVAINVYSCARTTDGSAWCWGVNGSGQLGDGTTIERHRAVRVTAAGGGNLARVSSVSAGAYNTCARTNDGSAWCWGGNDSGQLGDGTTTDRHRAVRVTSV